jgi:protein-S-isoprenylcysteine O-methyltransferase Ste14
MPWGLVRAIILLPGTVLVLIPALILKISGGALIANELTLINLLRFWLGLVSAAAGGGLMLWTVTLFTRHGQGTPAPWEPPRKLVIRGPYRHVRNPMISGVLLLLAGEALLLGSWPLLIWMGIFFLSNAVYFPLVEEKGLALRFGPAYREYQRQVPRWVPRRRPWSPESSSPLDDLGSIDPASNRYHPGATVNRMKNWETSGHDR